MKNFNQIHNELRPKVLGYLIKMTRNKELAEDLTSDTMLKLWNNLDKFDESQSSMNTWVLNIAKNNAIDYWRKKSINTTPIHEFVDDEGNESLEAPVFVTPLSEMMTKQIGEGIDFAINKLPANYREVANMFFKEQLSYEEISTELNKPVGTIKASIFRARKQLQVSLHNLV